MLLLLVSFCFIPYLLLAYRSTNDVCMLSLKLMFLLNSFISQRVYLKILKIFFNIYDYVICK